MPLIVRHEDDILRVVTDRGLCVARWADAPRAEHFAKVTTAMRAAAEGAGGAALLNVVDARGKLPRFDDGVRRAAAEMSQAITPIARGTAHVILIDGFSGAAVRMFLSTLTLVSRGRAPTTVHATVAAGAAWLAERAGQEHTAASIENAYAVARG